jgi:hypothetical protein
MDFLLIILGMLKLIENLAERGVIRTEVLSLYVE